MVNVKERGKPEYPEKKLLELAEIQLMIRGAPCYFKGTSLEVNKIQQSSYLGRHP